LALNQEENPLVDQVFINIYYPVTQEWREEALATLPHVRVIASLKNRQPLFLEHTYGEGRIVTCLSAAGPLLNNEGLAWTNWADGPGAASFAVLQLELVSLLAQTDRNPPAQLVGEPLEAVLAQAQYQPELEVVTPTDDILRISATDQPADAESEEEGSSESSSETGASGEATSEAAATNYHAIVRETGSPGVYVLRLNTQAGEQEERWISFNTSPQESVMELVEDVDLVRDMTDANVTVHPAGDLSWIQFDSQGQEPRWWILGLLIVFMLAEQMLAYRLSYHPT
jgi:hypothetical protein